ncbi:MAG: MFS transporter [Chloroflexota bacterium]
MSEQLPAAGLRRWRRGARLPAEGWQRNVWALIVAIFMSALGFVFVAPLLPLLLAEMLGGSEAEALAWAGVAFGITPLLSAIVAPFWTRLSERFGHRTMLLRSLGTIGLCMVGMAVARGPLDVVLLRVVTGVFGAFVPASVAALVASTPRQETGRAIGTAQAAQVSGSVAGPLLGGVLADWLGLRVPFLAVGLIFFGAFFLVAFLYRDLPREAAEKAVAVTPAPGRAMPTAVPLLWLLWGANFVAQFTDSIFGPLLPLYLAALRAPGEALATVTGLTVSLGALGAAVASYLAPRLFARRGLRVMAFSLLVAAFAFAPLALANVWWQVPPLRAFIGVLGGTVATLSYVVAATVAAPGQGGAAVTKIASAGLLGWAAGAFTCSALAGAGPRLVFGADAALLAVVGLALLLRRR